jgi:hypothetical protein
MRSSTCYGAGWLGDCFPTICRPRTTVYRWFSQWRDTGLFESMNHLLVMADRERVGREASPSAAVLDSQSVKTTESGGPRGLMNFGPESNDGRATEAHMALAGVPLPRAVSVENGVRSCRRPAPLGTP